MIYDRELSAVDVRALNTMCNRVTDFTTGQGGTDIDNLWNGESKEKKGIFDLQGRRVERPVRGLYIINGKKVVVK